MFNFRFIVAFSLQDVGFFCVFCTDWSVWIFNKFVLPLFFISRTVQRSVWIPNQHLFHYSKWVLWEVLLLWNARWVFCKAAALHEIPKYGTITKQYTRWQDSRTKILLMDGKTTFYFSLGRGLTQVCSKCGLRVNSTFGLM